MQNVRRFWKMQGYFQLNGLKMGLSGRFFVVLPLFYTIFGIIISSLKTIREIANQLP